MAFSDKHNCKNLQAFNFFSEINLFRASGFSDKHNCKNLQAYNFFATGLRRLLFFLNDMDIHLFYNSETVFENITQPFLKIKKFFFLGYPVYIQLTVKVSFINVIILL